MVTPLAAVTISPGLVALPLGMFSVRAATKTKLMGIWSLAMAQAAETEDGDVQSAITE